MLRNTYIQNTMAIFIMVSTFIFSQWILSYYQGGDQRYYGALYQALRTSTFQDAFALQYKYTTSREPLYAVFMWLFSKIFQKNFIISCVNAIFAGALFVFMSRHRAAFIFQSLIFTNYYFIVLLTSAERLKFAYLFAVMSVLTPTLPRIGLAMMSVMSHFSAIFLLAPAVLGAKFREMLNSIRHRDSHPVKSMATLCLFLTVTFAYYILNKQSIEHKLQFYLTYDVSEVIQSVALLVIAVVISSDRWKSAIIIMIPVLAAYFLGGDRINMIAASLFCYIAVLERKTRNLLVLFVLGYLSYKSIGYIINVYTTGNGFVLI